jgi:hypothetical protein
MSTGGDTPEPQNPIQEDAMASEWTRRDVIRGLGTAVLAWALPPAGSSTADAAEPDQPAPPRDRVARRRWALARMDEMAGERLRCRERYQDSRRIRECEAAFERRHRAYNELYLEAARE